jgi:hypothetical protein
MDNIRAYLFADVVIYQLVMYRGGDNYWNQILKNVRVLVILSSHSGTGLKRRDFSSFLTGR